MLKRFLMKRIDPATQIVLALVCTGITMGLLIATIILHIGVYNG